MAEQVTIDGVERRGGEIVVKFNGSGEMYFRELSQIRDFIARPKENPAMREALTAILAEQPTLDNPAAINRRRYTTRSASRENL